MESNNKSKGPAGPAIILSGHVGKTEEFIRPNHHDFMDAEELRKMQFSGLRHNSISDDIEIWVHGEVRRRVTRSERVLNPAAVDQAFTEVFMQDGCQQAKA